MDLVHLVKVLWRKIWILIAIPLIAAAAAYMLTRNMTQTFWANSQIATGYTTNDQVHLTEDRINIRDADVKFNNLLNMLNSGIATDLLSYRLLLHDLNPAQVPFHRPDPTVFTETEEEKALVYKLVKNRLDSLKPLVASHKDYALIKRYQEAYGYSFNQVKGALAISRIPNTDFVQIDFGADRAALAALAANGFTEEFIRYHNSFKVSQSGESVDFLRQVVEEKKRDLDRKLQAQKSFKSDNNVLDVHGESGAKMLQLSDLETQADLSRANITRYQLMIQRLNEDIRNAATPVATGGNQRVLDLKSRIDRVNDRYVSGGMKDQRLADSLAMLRQQLSSQIDNVSRVGTNLGTGITIGDLRTQLKDAEIDLAVERSTLASIESKIRNLQYNISGYASKEASLSTIEKEVELASQEYLAATEKYNLAKNKMVDSNTLRQVLVAVPPSAPETSKRLLIIALAGVTSLVLCMFAVVGVELIDGSVRTPEKFKRMVGLPLAGSINRIDQRNFNIRTYFNQTDGTEDAEMFKSQLRKLRHEIESMNAKVILFTSPNRREGKTFTMLSLSYVLSLVNKRVLIIDTNFKNNSLSQLLGRTKGDLKVLDSKARKLLTSAHGSEREQEPELEQDNSYDLINPTKYKNIYIVGNSGGGSESPAEILSGRDFGNLITALSDSFDYILLEGAALNDYSDTKELVKYSDKVVSVFSAESSLRNLDRESIYFMKSLGKKFGGAILNRVNSKDLKL